MDTREIRLRVVEALTRSDGAVAVDTPNKFLKCVAEIETYVVEGLSTDPQPAPTKRKPRQTDKAKPNLLD